MPHSPHRIRPVSAYLLENLPLLHLVGFVEEDTRLFRFKHALHHMLVPCWRIFMVADAAALELLRNIRIGSYERVLAIGPSAGDAVAEDILFFSPAYNFLKNFVE